MAAREMGKLEGIMWIIGTIVVLSIVLYSVGGFDLIYHAIHQLLPKASLSQ
jgi:hypothetical protein